MANLWYVQRSVEMANSYPCFEFSSKEACDVWILIAWLNWEVSPNTLKYLQ